MLALEKTHNVYVTTMWITSHTDRLSIHLQPALSFTNDEALWMFLGESIAWKDLGVMTTQSVISQQKLLQYPCWYIIFLANIWGHWLELCSIWFYGNSSYSIHKRMFTNHFGATLLQHSCWLYILVVPLATIPTHRGTQVCRPNKMHYCW